MKRQDTGISRRNVLKLAAAVPLLSLLPAGCSKSQPDIQMAGERMMKVLNHPEKAREIGAMYLRQTGSGVLPSFEQLTLDLMKTLQLNPDALSSKILRTIRSRLSKQVRQDFAEENIIILQGWMLSETELKLCALWATST